MTHPADAIGPCIRRRRKHLGFSLTQLAKASGVSVTMLSEVERAVKNPTVKLAWQIARALDCSLTDLLQEGPPPAMTVLRAADRRTLVDPETGVERQGVATALRQRGLEVATYRLPKGCGTGAMAPNRPGVLEHVVVFAGTLTLVVGDDRVRVRKGDQVTYGPQATVEYMNDGTRPCAFLLLSDRSRAHAP